MALYPAYGGGGEPIETVLWVNSAPTSNFATQTITLNDSIDGYDLVRVYCRASTSNATTKCVEFPANNFKLLSKSGTSSAPTQIGSVTIAIGSYYQRMLYDYNSTTRQVTFGNAFITTDASTAKNGYVIPTSITGVKLKDGVRNNKHIEGAYMHSASTYANGSKFSNDSTFYLASYETDKITVLQNCIVTHIIYSSSGNPSYATDTVTAGTVYTAANALHGYIFEDAAKVNRYASGTIDPLQTESTKITLGFKPKYICMYLKSMGTLFIYDESISTTHVKYYNGSWTNIQLATTYNIGEIESIDDDGFTVRKDASASSTRVYTYIATN